MAWRYFWPFGRKQQPTMLDCRANGNWVRGDLAVCTIDDWEARAGAPVPIKGQVYRVSAVQDSVKERSVVTGSRLRAYWLKFDEFPDWWYQSNTFRKVVPDHSACEDEFRKLLLIGSPEREPLA